MRNVAGKHFKSHCDPLFKKLSIIKFCDLLPYNQNIFMYKLLNGKQPDSFEHFFNKAPIFESDTNRRAFCYQEDKLKNEGIGRFPTAALPRSWNSNDMETKIISSLKTFKKSTYFLYLDKYNGNIQCWNLSCPDCQPAHLNNFYNLTVVTVCLAIRLSRL